MSVVLVTHGSSFEHEEPAGHPERADRLVPVMRGARSAGVPIVEAEAPAVDRGLLSVVHANRYVDHIEGFCQQGGGSLDPDTYAVPGSFAAALHAAGAGPRAVDAITRGEAQSAFIAVRPPGHHAERSQAMGFCLFNNIAVTAAYLRRRGERVAIVDWDVHHGNGTQSTFYRDPDVLYASLHQFPFYPGTGWVDERGDGPGRGMTVNVALPAGVSAESYLAAFARVVLPVVEQFGPDWILVSNGYDAHQLDPIGGFQLESEHYGWMADAVARLAPDRRVVALLEGGYSMRALEEASAWTVRGLGGEVEDVAWPDKMTGSAEKMVDLAVGSVSKFWELH
ncbi:MAG: histone deacetylase [Actinomycetota bacterium]